MFIAAGLVPPLLPSAVIVSFMQPFDSDKAMLAYRFSSTKL